MLNTKQRKNIVRAAHKALSIDNPDFSSMSLGEFEKTQDMYIEQECIKSGYELSHFYAIEGKKLKKILTT